MTQPGRPPTGAGHYLRDLIYGASDGVVTTFAVVASVAGAALSARVAFVIGLAKLAADALSMAAANYLALRSELGQAAADIRWEKPWRHAAATFLAFVAAGAVPLAAFFLHELLDVDMLAGAAALAGVTLVAVGVLRAPLMRERGWVSAAEMLVVGGVVGVAAYIVSLLADAALA